MNYYSYELQNGKNVCLADAGGCIPNSAAIVDTVFSPLVFCVDREPSQNRGIYGIRDISELFESENIAILDEVTPIAHECDEFVSKHGATVLNTAFKGAFSFLQSVLFRKKEHLIVELVGLGDVGGTLLTALKLIGNSIIDEIRIFDFNDKQCSRYEMELNQIQHLI